MLCFHGGFSKLIRKILFLQGCIFLVSCGQGAISSNPADIHKNEGRWMQSSLVDNSADRYLSKSPLRDIVFVVDVSMSMPENDPVNNTGSCGRFDAIDAVISKLKLTEPGVHVAVVTFSSVIILAFISLGI